MNFSRRFERKDYFLLQGSTGPRPLDHGPVDQARSQRGGIVCNAPTTNLDAPTRNLQNIKEKHGDRPAKRVRHVPHPRVAYVEPPLLETTHFQKCMHMQVVLCSVMERVT